MNDENKTHYRKAFHSPYLGAADVVDPIVLTIKRVTLEQDKTKKTKDYFNTAHFVERHIRPGEPLKPMILNATNSKKLAELTGSKFIDDWNGVPVTVYVDPNVSFGRDKVEGLRLAGADTPMLSSAGLMASVQEAETTEELKVISKAGQKHFRGDAAGFKEFAAAVQTRGAALRASERMAQENQQPQQEPEEAAQ